ncbi:hypothetical protein TSUD_135660 [Trifolium subterraneum]|uniref:Uncharacterized protein n=1 Tax=Trifolium subterraneum TaxID=3900 RepID=A0A2Z6P744_TRISU|nr:hypothetical protein TSUD_135660 [Trifolium subterraneum]
MTSKRSQKSIAVNSYSDLDDFDLFINSDVEHHFINIMSSKSFHTERGFVFSMKDEELSIPEEFARIITGLGWTKFARQSSSYNSQCVKEFYANLTNRSQMKREVVLRGKGILYSEANINKYFNV